MSTDPKNFELELTSGNVKAAMKAAGGTSADLWKVPRQHIRTIPGFNVRSTDDPEYIAQVRRIADSIKIEGFYADKPITGYVSRDGDTNIINVTDGHTRLDAVDLAISEGAEIVTLPVVVTERGTSMEDLTVRLVTTNSGRQLKPMEIGLVCKRLLGYGMQESVIAARLGITTRYIDSLLELAAAPRAIREMVSTGKVSATMAIETIKKDGDKAPEQLTTALKKAQGEGKNRITKKDLPKTAKPKQTELEGATPAPPRTPSKAVSPDPDNGVGEAFQSSRDQESALYAAYREWLTLSVKDRQTFRDCFPKIVRHFDAAQAAGERL